jgi:nicotinic acetylcholine receptor
MLTTLCCCWCFGLLIQPASCGNPDAKRLYDDLLSNYNKIVRPVVNNSDVLKVRIKLKLSQLIDLASVLFFLSFSLYPLFVFFQQLRKL